MKREPQKFFKDFHMNGSLTNDVAFVTKFSHGKSICTASNLLFPISWMPFMNPNCVAKQKMDILVFKLEFGLLIIQNLMERTKIDSGSIKYLLLWSLNISHTSTNLFIFPKVEWSDCRAWNWARKELFGSKKNFRQITLGLP